VKGRKTWNCKETRKDVPSDVLKAGKEKLRLAISARKRKRQTRGNFSKKITNWKKSPPVFSLIANGMAITRVTLPLMWFAASGEREDLIVHGGGGETAQKFWGKVKLQ